MVEYKCIRTNWVGIEMTQKGIKQMKKRILALALTIVMMATALPIATLAVPFAPSATAWKDFGQQNIYLYEVTKGERAPKIDGYVTDTDGYGKPVATYGLRYCTTAQYVTPDIDNGEFKLRADGTYYVYPTHDSPQEVWDAIQSVETDSPYGYIYTGRVLATSFSATTLYYYRNPQTLSFSTAYHVTKETFKNYTVLNRKGEYVLNNVEKLTEQPADWETNFANYYTANSGYVPVQATEDGKAPSFSGKTYYKGDRITVDKLYLSASNTSTVFGVTYLKDNHVILPEEINVYARYDDDYLYYALELTELKHKTAYYRNNFYFGTTMSNLLSVFANSYDFGGNITREAADGSATTMGTSSSGSRTYINGSQTLVNLNPILRKYGNLEATSITELTQAGSDYAITHTPYQAPVKNEEEDIFGGFGEDSSDELSSGTYGTTVYEYRTPWKVLNGKYNPQTDSTPVPETFMMYSQVQLENSLASGNYMFAFHLPRETRHLPGSLVRGSGNYPKDLYTMRLPHRTGLTEGEDYGTYNFMWAGITYSYGVWDPYVSDYASVKDRKTSYIGTDLPFVYYTAGQEPKDGYVEPNYVGANIRADGAENQKIRIQFSIPETTKEIEEAGVIVAPTEVARRNQLKLGMSSIAYYCEDYPVLMGVTEDGKWVNMTENTEKYFNDTAVPNDSDSFVASDVFGGKPSGIYTVYTLPADLENSAGKHKNAETGEIYGDMYSVVFGGANGEGLYHDFDDFFTFYTFRPYILYKDGTVTYGEQEFKSIYYLACWTIQEMISRYNEQVVGDTDVATHYNMDEMYLATVTGADGKTLKDPEGNNLYVPVPKFDASLSPYGGSAELSIYLPEPRLEIFRWYAVRLLNRANAASLRAEYYEDFHPDVKVLVDEHVQRFENLWNVILECESTRYEAMK